MIQILLRNYNSLFLEAYLASATSDKNFHLLWSQASIQSSERASFDSDSSHVIIDNFHKQPTVIYKVTCCATKYSVDHALLYSEMRGG